MKFGHRTNIKEEPPPFHFLVNSGVVWGVVIAYSSSDIYIK